MSESASGSFQIAQIYLRSSSFGYRVDPLSLPHDTKVTPQQIQISAAMFGLRAHKDGSEAVEVQLRVTSNPDDENALYNFDLVFAALVHEVDKEKFPPNVLAATVAAMLYPFLREIVANLTMRGRFGPVWLKPIDVRQLNLQAATNEPAPPVLEEAAEK